MFLGVEYGLGIAVGISLLIVIWESAYPHTAELGRLPGTTVYRDILQYSGAFFSYCFSLLITSLSPDFSHILLNQKEAERYDGLVIARVDAPIYFANAARVRDKIRSYKREAMEELQERNSEMTVQYIILDFSPVSRVDTTGLHMLEDMYSTQKQLRTQLCLCNPSIEVTDRLIRSGLADKLGRQYMFTSVIDAVQRCLHDMDANADASSTEEP